MRNGLSFIFTVFLALASSAQSQRIIEILTSTTGEGFSTTNGEIELQVLNHLILCNL